MQAIYSTLPVLGALLTGWLGGRLLPANAASRLVSFIGPLVWMLLFLIGTEFGAALSSLESIGYVIRTSVLLITATTAVPCLLLMGLALSNRRKGLDQARRVARGRFRVDMSSLLAPLKECVIALMLVAAGVLLRLALGEGESSALVRWVPSSNLALMVLIVLVGVDLTNVKVGRGWMSWDILSVPATVVAGSLIAAGGVHLLTGEDLQLLMALSTGFGWFTLSSALIGSLSSELHGATALFVDLGRELVAIVLLYLLGKRSPKLGIASAGATAMDSTLPIVRQACSAEALPVALTSGFILTILAPFFITAFLG